jgi:cytochrome c-type biogenesis protein CcsB
MNQTNWAKRLQLIRVLLLVNVLGMSWMAYKVLEPFLLGTGTAKVEEAKLTLPRLNYASWNALPVLEKGRVKPLETVAVETVRQVTGRATLEGEPAMAILLSWAFYDPKKPGAVDWENEPFLLCEDRVLRAKIFGVRADDPAAQEQINGKRIAPSRLRQSEDFNRLIVLVEKKRKEDSEKFEQKLEPTEKKAWRVKERLDAFDHIAASSQGEEAYLMDPIHFVALDKVPDAPWFSMSELRHLITGVYAPVMSREENSNQLWWNFLRKSRILTNPKPYLAEPVKQALAEFQNAIATGQVDRLIDELSQQLQERMEKELPQLIQEGYQQQSTRLGLDKMSEDELKKLIEKTSPGQTPDSLRQRLRQQVTEQLTTTKKKELQNSLTDLQARVKSISKPYVAEDPKYNQMYMDYLEARFPEMYNQAVKSQSFPAEPAKRVLASFDAVAAAYRAGDAARFDDASQQFFQILADVSNQYMAGRYPGVDTIGIELNLNRVEPFKWAWISMLLAAILFAAALQLENRWVYFLGFAPFFVSLGFQVFAYFCRCSISGRPPVSNMYETVVFVSSMAAVFALILEAFYRSKIIILSGAIIATLGLIMADQLPVSRGFDSKIEPLVPVLRSNYWLIIHVMTIVASYAAGALAWTIGNISLVMYWFNSDRKDLLRTMANFCYAAIKFAVLLLGVGTFLGGIWAAESWGRFWGWDPKETWAFIALVVYIIPLHARYIGWVRDFGMAVSSVVCFSAIVMSWYGVNFVLAAGLHSYGMGDGGPWTIFLLGSMNLLWVLIVCQRRAKIELAGQSNSPAV